MVIEKVPTTPAKSKFRHKSVLLICYEYISICIGISKFVKSSITLVTLMFWYKFSSGNTLQFLI